MHNWYKVRDKDLLTMKLYPHALTSFFYEYIDYKRDERQSPCKRGLEPVQEYCSTKIQLIKTYFLSFLLTFNYWRM